MDFEIMWRKIKKSLVEKTTIKNWTYHQWTKDKEGYLGRNFTAKYIPNKSIVECYPTNWSKPQKIPKRAFEILYENWESYRKGLLIRNKLRDKTRFSKYTISIFHHLKILPLQTM